ncbi:type II toxin-antitoxin system Phd/YefM family antitoxin [Actinotalea subterranea]|uniref:type II toxin-antitoxin system Phd/YefM family antitoxin n=1 Tax=Actinotalea subterranea TaxID=2607497 RepID=UPI0011EFD4C8|nr:type II toxin-antitoxin system Phd/YefM family antitoxin [Actinotalea subterranea]
MSQTSLTDAKAHLSAYAQDVVSTHERLSITRNGRRELVLVAADDLDALEETLDILANQHLMSQMQQAKADLDAGLGVELDALPPRE